MSFLYSGSSFIPKPIQTALDLKADTTFVEDTSINTPAYSFWVADGRNDINSVLPLIINQGSVVYFSQGSFGGDAIVVSNKNNLAFIGPKSSPPIVELVRAITIDATTQRLRISNFLFGGVATLNGSSCRYSYCDFKENVNMADLSDATVTRNAGNSDVTSISGYYEVECYGADGVLKWKDDIHNLVTTVGKNFTMDTILGNVAGGAVIMGLKGDSVGGL